MDTQTKSKIIVVDDEPLILTTIEKALARHGYMIKTAKNRKHFVSALQDGPYDLCILDLHMKDISSEEIKHEVLAMNPHARFLIISGSEYGEPGYFLQKPFKIEALRQMVKEILGVE